MTQIRARLRWQIAHLLNQLPGQCWARLVGWALGSSEHRWPWQPQDDLCRRDLGRTGSCYCTKLRAPQTTTPDDPVSPTSTRRPPSVATTGTRRHRGCGA